MPGKTAVGPHEIVTEIVVPAPAAGSAGAFLKLSKTSEDIAKVNVAVMVALAGGVCSRGAHRRRVGGADARAGGGRGAGCWSGGPLGAAGHCRGRRGGGRRRCCPISDVRSTARYREEMVRVLVRDALEQGAPRAARPRKGGVMAKEIATFLVNGQEYEVIVEPHMLLIDVLRDQLGLTGTKYACGAGDCGACTVLIDGRPSFSCLTLAVTAKGKSILTIEGRGRRRTSCTRSSRPSSIKGAVQCGFCTPGMILSAKALLDENPEPTRDEIKTALAGNLCRCTGYVKIVDAVEAAAAAMRNGGGR